MDHTVRGAAWERERASETGMPEEGERGGAPAAGDEAVANAALTAERRSGWRREGARGGGRALPFVRARQVGGRGRAEMS